MNDENAPGRGPNQNEAENGRTGKGCKVLSVVAAAASLLFGSHLASGSRFQSAIEQGREQAIKVVRGEASDTQPGPLLLLPAYMGGNPVALVQHDSHSSHSSHSSHDSHSSHSSHASHSSGL